MQGGPPMTGIGNHSKIVSFDKWWVPHHPSPDHDLVLKHIETIMRGLGIHQNY
jgi:hypothetical protein